MFRIPTKLSFEEWRSTSGALILIAIDVRLIAALVLIFGPWTDQAAELAGWDVERFVAIASDNTKPWTEADVEYPPASVIMFEGLTAVGQRLHSNAVVGAHRALVVAMLVCDLASAWLLRRRFGDRAMATYLLIGLPLVPMGLLRLDLLTTFLAMVAAVVVFPQRLRPTSTSVIKTLAASAALVFAAAIKLWPALLIAPFWLLGKRRIAAAVALAGAVTAAVWLLWAQADLEPIRQVLTLRGATGWHVESTAGLVTTLTRLAGGEGAEAVLELNAFRIGAISPVINTLGRLSAVVTLILLGVRAGHRPANADGINETAHQAARLAAVVLGSLGMLLATAPLFSPQFMLWLTPWVAVMSADNGDAPTRSGTAVIWLAAGACLITGVVLAIFGPAGITAPVPVVLLVIRNVMVASLAVACWFWLGALRSEIPDRSSGPGL